MWRHTQKLSSVNVNFMVCRNICHVQAVYFICFIRVSDCSWSATVNVYKYIYIYIYMLFIVCDSLYIYIYAVHGLQQFVCVYIYIYMYVYIYIYMLFMVCDS